MIQFSLHTWRDLLKKLQKNPVLLISYVLLLPIIEYFYIAIRVSGLSNRINVSLADCYVFLLDRLFVAVTLVPLSLVLFINLFKHDFTVPFLIRQKSKYYLWLAQIFQIFITNIFLTIYITIVTYFIGGLYVTNYINWNSDLSLYYLVNGTVAYNIRFLQVLVLFFIMSVLIFSLVNIIFQIISWLYTTQIIAWLVVFFIASWDIAGRSIFIIYGRFSINYIYWYEFKQFIINITVGVFSITIISILGKSLAKKRDFFNESI